MTDPFAPDDSLLTVPDAEPDALDSAELAPLVPVGPTPPRWYKKPSKPKFGDVLGEGRREQSLHRKRLSQAAEMARRLNLDYNAIFERYHEAWKVGEHSQFTFNDLRDEHNAMVRAISQMDWRPKNVYRDVLAQDDALAIEDAVAFLFECEERQHARAGNGALKVALPDTAGKYGMLVGYDGLDFDDEECGLRMRLIDPATVFPVFEGERGLARVYRLYRAAANDVVGWFGGFKPGIESKVRKLAQDEETGGYNRWHQGEVFEYYDRNWMLVAYKGEMLFCVEHGYAEVPFTVTPVNSNQQPFTSRPDTSLVGSDAIPLSGSSDLEGDIARMYEPFLWPRVQGHDMDEMVMSFILTKFRQNPLVLKQSITAATLNDVEVERDEDGLTRITNEDDLGALPNQVDPGLLQTVLGAMQQNRMTGMAQGVLNGQAPPQTSGSALDIMTQSGLDKFMPIVGCIERFLVERSEKRLRLLRDWGAILPTVGDAGTLLVPRRAAPVNPVFAEATHQLTVDTLANTQIRLKVSLARFNINSLAAGANGMAIVNSLGVVDKRLMIDLLNLPDDPDAILRRIELDQFDEVPEYKQARFLEWAQMLAAEAQARGEPWVAQLYQARAQFLAGMMDARLQDARMQGQQTLMGMQPPGTPQGTPSDQPPGTAPPPPSPYQSGSPVQSQGMSLPPMGMPPGTQGGRPMGTNGIPQQGTQGV